MADVSLVPFARSLPTPPPAGDSTVYIIGHPGGGVPEFSFQDNALRDHEGIPGASPLSKGVCRVHHQTPTEKGRSYSRVFNRTRGEAVALHHRGCVLSRLNGQSETYGANEGIALQWIRAAIKATTRP